MRSRPVYNRGLISSQVTEPWRRIISAAELPAITPAAQLIDAISRGDSDAFAELYDASAPAVYGVVSHLFGDSERREAVFTQVFLELWQNAGQVRDSGIPPERYLIARAAALHSGA